MRPLRPCPQGVPLGSATGAGGNAPKLLLTEGNQGELRLDGTLADDLAARHWLVKFPRNQGRASDQNVLRSEYRYYLALDSLGLETIPVNGLALEEGRQTSLWLPRFDRRPGAAGLERVAVESIYSLTDTLVPGSYLVALSSRTLIDVPSNALSIASENSSLKPGSRSAASLLALVGSIAPSRPPSSISVPA
ncbi:TPA: HipA domain-containing protein [Pseudomonas aeruginosa]|nr:HipA domain-containing protein [Pseudomonas aeruginosa]